MHVGSGQRTVSITLVFAVAVWKVVADESDINIRLFSDSNCHQFLERRLLMNEGCYANTFSGTGAFSLKIVAYDRPQSLDVTLYPGYCNEKDWSTSRRQIVIGEGQCSRFPSATSSTYAELTLRERSSICGSNLDVCSNLVTVQQQFFEDQNCEIPIVTQFHQYPGMGECLTTTNGTMTFRINPSAPDNITQTVFLASPDCGNGAPETFERRMYNIQGGNCYELYNTRAPRSFRWQTYDIANVYAASSGRRSAGYPWKQVITNVCIALAIYVGFSPV